MGLDQSAGYNDVSVYDWRKHARLQQFMHDKYFEKHPDAEGFNVAKLILNKEDILEKSLKSHETQFTRVSANKL